MKRRRLSAEEAALWRRTVLDVRPQNGRALVDNSVGGALAPGETAGDPAPRPRNDSQTKPARQRPAVGARSRDVSVLNAGDPAVDRRLARRRTPLDSVLDLHGLTQDQARRRLLDFLTRAALSGDRRLLVITGKGGAASASSMTRARLYGEAPRGGVLRQRFLDWVDEPECRALISRVSQASPRDGGAGAFYIFLKRKT